LFYERLLKSGTLTGVRITVYKTPIFTILNKMTEKLAKHR